MLFSTRSKPQLAILIDPDKFNPELVTLANSCAVSYIFVGGSKLKKNNFETTIKKIKSLTQIPVIIFPGNLNKQVSSQADALLFLSLLSGRNAEYLIGQHVEAAPVIKKKKIITIPTGYILIEGGKKSTTQKVTKTTPISKKNSVLAVNTAIAGELLGMKLIYLEAGSGAKNVVPESLIKKVKQSITIPLIVGGGIDSVEKTKKTIKAGANIIVVGNALEKNILLLKELCTLF